MFGRLSNMPEAMHDSPAEILWLHGTAGGRSDGVRPLGSIIPTHPAQVRDQFAVATACARQGAAGSASVSRMTWHQVCAAPTAR